MTDTGVKTIPVPLQLDLDYVDAAHDACFAWLRGQYAHLRATVPAAPLPDSETKSGTVSSSGGGGGGAKAKKPQISTTELQQFENDLTACDTLRWRPFAFPSHPTLPLTSSYRNEPGKKGKPNGLTAELHKVINKRKGTTADVTDDAKEAEASRYALVVTTQTTAKARKGEKKQKWKAKTATATAGVDTPAHASPAADVAPTPPPVQAQALLEKVVREEEEQKWCQLLGEDYVSHASPPSAATTMATPSPAHTAVWWHFPRSWRPLLGGYVSAPSRTDSARLLLFPQAHHTPVDFRDGTAGTSLLEPQWVPWYLRGSVTWDAERHNPAAGSAAAGGTSSSSLMDRAPRSAGLSYSLQAAQARPAPSALATRNWADVVEVAVAGQQTRTERMYAPAREKVQRVTLLEDTAAVTVSQGNPRSSLRVTAAQATVQKSGVKHQHEKVADTSADMKKKRKQQHQQHPDTSLPPTPLPDDTIHHLQIEDGYDSSVQHFALPRFWQRLVQPRVGDGVVERSYSTAVLESAAPRGQYRVRWSGGPGLEVCSSAGPSTAAGAAAAAAAAQQAVWWTVFGKLWTESWIEVPLPWRLALKLRTQSAITMPLEPSKPLWLPMVSDTPSVSEPNHSNRDVSSSRLCEHPYFWATQGPKWDAALVRGFKNDYSGMHHARRWYSVLSAELTMNGAAGQRGGGKNAKASGGGRGRQENDDVATSEGEGERTSESPASPPASRWSDTALTAFANACVVDTLRDYPRASVGVSLTSKIPRLAISPFNEITPHTFECSFSWFAAFKAKPSGGTDGGGGGGGGGVGVEFRSGMEQQAGNGGGGAAAAPLLRVSPVETFQHMKCGLTWKFD